jgi:hypothetical protein
MFRCDIDITGDLVLPPNVGKLTNTSAADVWFAFANGPVEADGHVGGMSITVIGPSESIEVAGNNLQRALAAQLSLLTFVTHSRFKIVSDTRVMEWEPARNNGR